MSACALLSTSDAVAQTDVPDAPAAALEGYCPVCIVKGKKWMLGKPEHQAEYDGKTYYFPGPEPRAEFMKSPEKYVPALGGDCTVCYAKMSKRVPGSIFHAAFHHDRLFLFPGADQKKMFMADPDAYADVDLAFGGNCSVCLKEMGKEMPGKAEHTVIYNGMKYLFPGPDQKAMFIKNPEKYAALTTSVSSVVPTTKPIAETGLVIAQGRSACAACDYGVKPLASNELGLAVKAANGTIFIVEDAHSKYPNIYKNRFNGIQLSLQGEVVKKQGSFVWVKPVSLSTL